MRWGFRPRIGVTARVAAGLALLAALFFSPALLGGRVLAPPGDGVLYYYPMRVHVAEVLRRGDLPLWNPYLFSGFPLLADIEAGAFYPLNVLFLLLPAPLAMNLVAISSYVLAALFTCLYARAIGATVFGGLVAGIAFGAGGFMVSHLGHASIVNAAAWFPLLMLFAERLRRGATWPDVAGAAATLAAQVFAGHPQVAAYSLLTAGLYVLFFIATDAAPGGRGRCVAACVAALVSGLLLAACQILPTWELTGQSNRAWISYEAFSEPALPFSHLLLFLFPYAFGGGSAGPYAFAPMGLSVAEATGYVGIIPLALALAALPLWRSSPHARFWLLLAALALVMALGPETPLHRVLFLLPGYNRFRAPARNLMQADLALAVLAGLAASRIPSLARAVRRSAAVLAVAVSCLAALILWIGPGWNDLLDPRAPRPLAPGALRPAAPFVWGAAGLALASALALFALARRDGPRTRRLVLAVLLADLGLFGELGYGPFLCPAAEALARPSPLMRVLEGTVGRSGASRFLSLTPEERPEDFELNEPNSSVLRRTASAGGNSSFVLGRYAKMVAWTDLAAGVDLAAAGKALDLPGVRRLIVADQLLFPKPRVSVQRVGLAEGDLGIRLARQRGNATELALPGLRCSAIAVDATSLSGRVREPEPLVRITAWTTSGERLASILRAGWEPIAWAGDAPRPGPSLAERLRGLWPAAREGGEHGAYRAGWELGTPRDLARVRLEDLGQGDALRIDRIRLHDAGTGHTLVLGGEGRPELARLHPVPHRLEVAVPPVAGSALVFTSAISGPTTLPQGQAMARVSAWTSEGALIERTLRAGEHTSEWAWERPDVRPKIRHRMAPVAETFPAEGGFRGHRYRGRVDLGGRHRIEKLVVEHVGPDSSLYVDRVDLLDEEAGTATRLPVEAVELQPALTAPPGPRELVLPVPPLPCSALAIVSALHDATAVHQGQAVARVTVRTLDGPAIEAVLHAGEETSEWAWDRPDVRPRVRHGRAAVAESFAVAGASYEGHRYASRLDLGGRRRVVEVRVATLAPVASLEVGPITFEDAEAGRSWSLPAAGIPAVLTPEETVPRVELEAPAVPVTEVVVASRLSRSLAVAQGQAVATLRAWAADGEVIEKPLRAGEDTSEWLAARPGVRDRLRHREAPAAFSAAAGTEPGAWYLGRMALGARRRLRKVAIEAVDPEAVLSVGRVSLYDAATGASAPLSAVRSLLAGPTTWRRLCATLGDTIYENTAALPRAWLVPRVLPLPEPDLLAAVRTGRLPGGEAFEPRRVALVEEGAEMDFGPLDPEARVELAGDSPNRATVTTHCRTPAFLVVGEVDYPGWRATLDGVPAPIVRTDYALRGLALPPGEHRIELEYRPRSFRLGLSLSAVALLGLAIAGRSARRRVWPPLAAVALLPAVWLAVAAGSLPVSGAPGKEPAGAASKPRDGVLDLAAVPGGATPLGPGWWPAEAWAMGEPGRWTAGEAVLRVERRGREAGLAVDMTFDHPAEGTAGRIDVGGRTIRAFRGPNGRRREIVDISDVPGRSFEVRIVADQFASRVRPLGRTQGVFVHSARLLESPVSSELDLGTAEDGRPELVSGWWGAEPWPGGPSGRWTGGRASLLLERREAEDGLVLDLSFENPEGVATGRIEVEGGPVHALRARNGRQGVQMDIHGVAGRTIAVHLVADRPFVPRQYDPSAGDGRTLGFFVHSVRLVPFPRCP